MVNIRKFPRGILDQVISKSTCDGESERAPGPGLKLQAPSSKPQAPSFDNVKRQASSPKQQASSVKPEASSSKILEPRYIWKRLEDLGPRAWIKIKVFLGCLIWNDNWCGLNRTFLPLVTFNSIVKKCPLLLQTSKSGVPSKLMFSSRVNENSRHSLTSFL